MPYVARDENGEIIAMYAEAYEGAEEHIPYEDEQVMEFLAKSEGGVKGHLVVSDADMARVTEDLVDLLIQKGVILFTELPEPAQVKMLRRQNLRGALDDYLDISGGTKVI